MAHQDETREWRESDLISVIEVIEIESGGSPGCG